MLRGTINILGSLTGGDIRFNSELSSELFKCQIVKESLSILDTIMIQRNESMRR